MGLKPLRWRLIHCVARLSTCGTLQIARPSLAKQNGEPAAILLSDNEGLRGILQKSATVELFLNW